MRAIEFCPECEACAGFGLLDPSDPSTQCPQCGGTGLLDLFESLPAEGFLGVSCTEDLDDELGGEG